MSRIGYVTCRVSPGFFENEFYVVVDDSSAFVDRKNVLVEDIPSTSTEVEGKVLAYAIEQQGDRTLVELPGEAVVGGLRTWVPNASFSPAPAVA
jgi:hypothetical protein